MTRSIHINSVIVTLTLGWLSTSHDACATNPNKAPYVPIIPRAAFLSETDKDNPKISADGALVSFTAPADGAVNVWVARSMSPEAAKSVTGIKDGALSDYYWSADSIQILTLIDGKDGHHRLESVGIGSEKRKILLDAQSRIFVFGTSLSRSNMVAIGFTRGDSKWPDLYSLNIDNGELTLVLENASFSDFLVDGDLKPVIGIKRDANNDTFVFALGRNGDHRSLFSLPADTYQSSSILKLSADGKTLYLLETRGRNTAVIASFDIASGGSKILCEDARTDVKRVFFDSLTREPLMCLVEYGTYSWTALDDSVRDDIAFLNSRMKGYWSPGDAAASAPVWLIYSDGMTEPSGYEIYNRKTRALTKVFLTTPGLVGTPLATTRAVQFQARDGLPLVAYLTLPRGTDPNGDGKPDHPLPTVLMVHGGPWGRAYQRLYLEDQLFANRGYAVLAVQFRGSTGFGRRFMEASYKQWGGTMQDDLLDAVGWAIKNRIAQPGKIAIYGRSYGGYAALLGIIKTPAVFACSVDISGPSDLASFINDAEEDNRTSWYEKIGDPRNSADLAMLHAHSPLFATEKLKRPLLIIQGGQDKAVHKSSSDQMAALLKKERAPFTYVVYPDEGHFFARPEDGESVLALSEAFLAKYLHGRSEPFGDLSKAKMQIVYGKERIFGDADKDATSSRRKSGGSQNVRVRAQRP